MNGDDDLLFDDLDLRPKPKPRRGSGGGKKKAERKSGEMSQHREIVLIELRRNPGRTGAELYGILCLTLPLHGDGDVKMNVYEVRRKLTDLKRMGFARQGKSRKCRVTRKRAVTWWQVRPTEALLLRGKTDDE